MKNLILISLFVGFLPISFLAITDSQCQNNNLVFKRQLILFASKFEIALVHNDEKYADYVIDSVISSTKALNNLISTWEKNSQTSFINKMAGIKAVKVDYELFELIRRANKVSELSNGAFDISSEVLNNIWKFDHTMESLPEEDIVKNLTELVNYKNIILNKADTSVFLKLKGMKIGFGAIGKGYVADKAKELMLSLGINSGMISAGGDLIAWGNGLNNKPWKVALADPNKKEEYISWFNVNNKAVATSGNYEKFFIFNNARYSHILSPKTGYPVKGLKSVTIICPTAELADALATSVFVLGENEGIELINKINFVECIIINQKDEVITSRDLRLKPDN